MRMVLHSCRNWIWVVVDRHERLSSSQIWIIGLIMHGLNGRYWVAIYRSSRSWLLLRSQNGSFSFICVQYSISILYFQHKGTIHVCPCLKKFTNVNRVKVHAGDLESEGDCQLSGCNELDNQTANAVRVSYPAGKHILCRMESLGQVPMYS